MLSRCSNGSVDGARAASRGRAARDRSSTPTARARDGTISPSLRRELCRASSTVTDAAARRPARALDARPAPGRAARAFASTTIDRRSTSPATVWSPRPTWSSCLGESRAGRYCRGQARGARKARATIEACSARASAAFTWRWQMTTGTQGAIAPIAAAYQAAIEFAEGRPGSLAARPGFYADVFDYGGRADRLRRA